HRYSGQSDIVVGTAIANRNRSEIEGLIGFFVNSLVMRTDLSGDPDFVTLLSRVRAVCLSAYAHQDLPFEVLVDELRVERQTNRNPLFQVAFVLQNAPMPAFESPGLLMKRIEVDNLTAKFDLYFELTDTAEGLVGAFEYSTDLFDETTICRLSENFLTLLDGIVSKPERPISSLPLLTNEEQDKLIIQWNKTWTDYPANSCIHELFEVEAERRPQAVALVTGNQLLTYAELNRRANQLAHYLQTLGVGAEAVVATYLERSPQMIVALLAILKAGGSYMPLDVANPKRRLALILQDSD